MAPVALSEKAPVDFDKGRQRSNVGKFTSALYIFFLVVNALRFEFQRAAPRFVTTKPRDIRQLASECSQIMAGVYYVVTLAT